MNLSIVSKQIELTDPIRSYIDERAVDAITKFNLDIIAVKAIISESQNNNHKKGVTIEFVIQLAGKDTVVIRQTSKDLYTAIDLAIDRAKKVLRRYHDKSISHRASHKQAVPFVVTDEENEEDEIVAADFDIDKPVSIDEALETFKHRGCMFLVFEDLSGKTRVVYRRKDSKVGLY
jgi:putative sigma-54 modulation protein